MNEQLLDVLNNLTNTLQDFQNPDPQLPNLEIEPPSRPLPPEMPGPQGDLSLPSSPYTQIPSFSLPQSEAVLPSLPIPGTASFSPPELPLPAPGGDFLTPSFNLPEVGQARTVEHAPSSATPYDAVPGWVVGNATEQALPTLSLPEVSWADPPGLNLPDPVHPQNTMFGLGTPTYDHAPSFPIPTITGSELPTFGFGDAAGGMREMTEAVNLLAQEMRQKANNWSGPVPREAKRVAWRGAWHNPTEGYSAASPSMDESSFANNGGAGGWGDHGTRVSERASHFLHPERRI